MSEIMLNQWVNTEFASDIPVSAPQRQWLLHSGSMTEMVMEHVENQFELMVINEHLTSVTDVEQEFLGLREKQAYVREIVMQGDGQPWLFARSVFPSHVMTQHNNKLLTLGKSPLGGLFFGNANERNGNSNPRESLEIATLSSHHELRQTMPSQFNTEQQLFARRSRFEYLAMSVLVQEVFLPAHPVYQE